MGEMTKMDWRMRCYAAEKWLSRLLGIDLNQVVDEAEKRVNHPLGKDEGGSGTMQDWHRADATILEGALARHRAVIADLAADPKRCTCAECLGVEVDLDRSPPDVPQRPAAAPVPDAPATFTAFGMTFRVDVFQPEGVVTFRDANGDEVGRIVNVGTRSRAPVPDAALPRRRCEVSAEGWGWPGLSKKAHYFESGIALCRRWAFTGKLEPETDKRSPDDCAACRKKLAARSPVPGTDDSEGAP